MAKIEVFVQEAHKGYDISSTDIGPSSLKTANRQINVTNP